MGEDDANEGHRDGQCPGHEFSVVQVHVDGTRLRMVHQCRWCPATSYEASRSDETDGTDGGRAAT